MKAKCLDCQKEIKLKGKTIVGDIIECPFCATEMEIVKLVPLCLRIIEEEK
ncbi:MAG: lysine biosynthesis protein LysW [Candidatus Shapirobacteria bacterium]